MIIEGKILNQNHQWQFMQILLNQNTAKIEKVEPNIGKADYSFTDQLIFPGFIDLHVHAREDESKKNCHKEDFKSAGFAAINGGVVCFGDMPNNPIPCTNSKTYRNKNELTKKAEMDIFLYAGIKPNSRPISKNIPYKLYMGPSTGTQGFDNDKQLDETLSYFNNHWVSFHCEDPDILKMSESQATFEKRRPPEAEIVAIQKAIKLIEKHKLTGIICHVSTRKGMELIIEAQQRNVDIYSEVTPHHLYFDETMINSSNKTRLIMNPPLRTKEDRLGLLDLLKTGKIDFLATDHAPHLLEEKSNGAAGVPHLDTYGSFVTWLLVKQGVSPNIIEKITSKNAAYILNRFKIRSGYGYIKEGLGGFLTIIDPHQKIKIHPKLLKTKCQWSPFENIEFPGNVVATVYKSQIKLIN